MIISEIATCHNEDSLRMGVFSLFTRRDISQQCSGEFLTKGRWCRLLLTPCRSTFAARHSYAGTVPPNLAPRFDLNCQILAAKIELFIQTLGCFCFLAPFLAWLWKRYHMGLGQD